MQAIVLYATKTETLSDVNLVSFGRLYGYYPFDYVYYYFIFRHL